MPKVKLTLFPDPVEVPEDEIAVLRAQGLVDDAPVETATRAVKATRKDEQS